MTLSIYKQVFGFLEDNVKSSIVKLFNNDDFEFSVDSENILVRMFLNFYFIGTKNFRKNVKFRHSEKCYFTIFTFPLYFIVYYKKTHDLNFYQLRLWDTGSVTVKREPCEDGLVEMSYSKQFLNWLKNNNMTISSVTTGVNRNFYHRYQKWLT